jgi:hypothetical protein
VLWLDPVNAYAVNRKGAKAGTKQQIYVSINCIVNHWLRDVEAKETLGYLD